MRISLFEHNQTAYEKAIAMLAEVGKAAIIHPTGTGKSFIGFKLCEEHPGKLVCWLSPSEYIFKTQMENLSATGADVPKNIVFFTYAKLMLMDASEINEIHPSYIILDEFHRCGAEMWGKGVQTLLNSYPDVPILGLSATNIRYLDNQRNMADELFDGNVASELTLGEAIVRGILLPPTYVVSVYSYQKELEKYQRRVYRAKSKAVRDAAQAYLDALRRALDKADGLDVVFKRHMPDPAGKYIVFCANVEHLSEMVSRVPEWFSAVDANPHIYTAYADDPDANKDFALFKQDTSEHHKLLICIDMLNEGVHVEDISGVILFRPTISPIIYKQQIGRALSANKTKQAVIFDVVNNFDNLYSIGVLEDEMQEAVGYYRDWGEQKEIVNERFQVIDEVRDCKKLFSELHNTLSASWELMYQAAAAFYKANGHLDIPKRFKTPEGFSLGTWLLTQRRVRAGKNAGILTEQQIAQLDAIGMQWDSRYGASWDKYYSAAKAYFAQHHDLNIPLKYVDANGVSLGQWISNIRQQRAAHTKNTCLNAERVRLLDALGMIWDKFSYQWEQNYLACAAYYLAHGNLEIPNDYVTPEGLRIGSWIYRMRKIRGGRIKNAAPLTEAQIARLDAIGMDWTDALTRRWEYGYAEAARYRETFGNLNVPSTYVSDDGYPLGKWLRKHLDIDAKTGKTAIIVTPERKEKLSALGMQWDNEDQWEKRIRLCREYYAEHGDLNISQSTVIDGIWLGKWLYLQCKTYRGEIAGATLTPEQIVQLESVGVDWRTPNERKWVENYAGALAFFQQHGDLNVPGDYRTESGIRLAPWLILQRANYRNNKLNNKQIKQLEGIGFQFESPSAWDSYFAALRDYAAENGTADVPVAYVTADGLKLGRWLTNQKALYNSDKTSGRALSKDRAERLESLGVTWKQDSQWMQSFERARQYEALHGGLNVLNPYLCEDGYDLGYWVYLQRRIYQGKVKGKRLTSLQVKQLESIGMVWLSKSEQAWEANFRAAEQYQKEHGHLRVPATFQSTDGVWLGSWIRVQRDKWRKGKLPVKQIKRLSAIGMEWEAGNTQAGGYSVTG